MRCFLIACATLAMAGAAAAQPAPNAWQESTFGAQLKGGDGSSLGQAWAATSKDGLLITLEVKGLTPGWHGVHLHEKDNCTPPAFKSAGAHAHHGPTSVHGLLNPDRTDVGDLPNIWVGADGTGKAQFYTTLLPLVSKDGGPGFFQTRKGEDWVNVALVVHAARDDSLTQPIGGSGDRVVCGVFEPLPPPLAIPPAQPKG